VKGYYYSFRSTALIRTLMADSKLARTGIVDFSFNNVHGWLSSFVYKLWEVQMFTWL
jgi:hypothetical protein